MIETIHARWSTIEVDYNAKIFYIIADTNLATWGIGFEFKTGYSADRPRIEGLGFGTGEDGIFYWVSVIDRPQTLEYSFELKKNGVVIDIYKIICVY